MFRVEGINSRDKGESDVYPFVVGWSDEYARLSENSNEFIFHILFLNLTLRL